MIAFFFFFSSNFLFGFQLFTILLHKHLDYLTIASVGSIFSLIFSSFLILIINTYFSFSITLGILVSFAFLFGFLVLFFIFRIPKAQPMLPFPFILLSIIIPSLFLCYLIHITLLQNDLNVRGSSFGDLPFHLNIISSFVHGCNSNRSHIFDILSPFFAGEPLAYAFIPDYLSSILIGCFNLTYRQSIVFPSYVFAFALFSILSRLVYVFSGNLIAPCIACWLFSFTGGTGFTEWVRNGFHIGFYQDFVYNWGNERIEYWLQTFIHFLLPQRGSLFSVPFDYAIILLLILIGDSTHSEIIAFSGIGLLIAALPLVQIHSVIGCAMWGVFYAFINFIKILSSNPKKNILPFIKNYSILGFIAIIFGLPQTKPYFSRINESKGTSNFFTFRPVWIDSNRNCLSLWFYGLGFFAIISLIIAPFFLSKKQRLYYYPSLFVFLVSNFILFQPWNVDNTKVFYASWIPLATAVIATFFIKIIRLSSENSFTFVFYILISLVLFVFCILSGLLSVCMLISQSYSLWKNPSSVVAFSNWVIKNTDPKSVWITSSSHTHPLVTLAGRQTLVGYNGWLESHGLNPSRRSHAIQDLVYHPEMTYGIDLYNVSYYCVWKEDSQNMNMRPNKNSTHWKNVYQTGEFIVYKRI